MSLLNLESSVRLCNSRLVPKYDLISRIRSGLKRIKNQLSAARRNLAQIERSGHVRCKRRLFVGGGLKQTDYIYDLYWPAAVDTIFIGVLVEQHAVGNFDPKLPNVMALEMAQAAIKDQCKLAFPLSYIKGRAEVLRKRFEVFSWIANKAEVKYDKENNKVYAAPSFWKEMVKEDDFAIAYMEDGDPSWNNLEKLFKPDQSILPLFNTSDEFGPPGIFIEVDGQSELFYTGGDVKGKTSS